MKPEELTPFSRLSSNEQYKVRIRGLTFSLSMCTLHALHENTFTEYTLNEAVIPNL
jgi:hypothetical protein